MIERRAADRVQLPRPLPATLGQSAVLLIEVSRTGARLEQEDRPGLGTHTQLKFDWDGYMATIDVTVVRSEISGRRGATLIYQSGVRFEGMNPVADSALALLIGERVALQQQGTAPPPESPASVEPQPVVVSQPAMQPVGSASVERSTPATAASYVNNPFGRDEDDPRYIRCRLGEHGWIREYVDSPEQPDEGFTVSIEQRFEVESLQQAYEHAEREMRDMMRRSIAIGLQD